MAETLPAHVLRRALGHQQGRSLAPVGDGLAVDLPQVREAVGQEAGPVGLEGNESIALRLDEERQVTSAWQVVAGDACMAVDAKRDDLLQLDSEVIGGNAGIDFLA
ncbi:MAG: hypothetical protein IH787_04195 [Nitrospirae bacterium]|nr:hypothetical protein [Nitrospirota bacterium]